MSNLFNAFMFSLISSISKFSEAFNTLSAFNFSTAIWKDEDNSLILNAKECISSNEDESIILQIINQFPNT